MKTLYFFVFVILSFTNSFGQEDAKSFGLASQISLNGYMYRYRLYDSQLLLGVKYKNNYFLGGVSITNEVSITPELSYNNKFWPQNIGQAFLYCRKFEKSYFNIGYSRNKVLNAHNFSIITNNIEKTYSNKVFTEEVFASYSYNVFEFNKASIGASFKMSLIKEYNYFSYLTLGYEDFSKKYRVVPSIGLVFKIN